MMHTRNAVGPRPLPLGGGRSASVDRYRLSIGLDSVASSVRRHASRHCGAKRNDLDLTLPSTCAPPSRQHQALEKERRELGAAGEARLLVDRDRVLADGALAAAGLVGDRLVALPLQ